MASYRSDTNKYKITNLKLRISTQQYIKSLQVILIREDLDYAIHQVELGQLIFAIHNLYKIIEKRNGFSGKKVKHVFDDHKYK